jgi:hypothetical protein
MKINELENGINDAWFDHGGFETYKKPSPIKYQTAIDSGTVETLEGTGDYGAVKKDIFAQTYDTSGA